VISFVKKRHEGGERATVIVISEGASPKEVQRADQEKMDEFGHVRLGGIGQFVGEQIEKATQYDTRVSVLGHMIRGGSPTAFDRVLSTQFGLAAVDLIKEGKFGRMVSLRGTKITTVSLEESTSKQRLLDAEILRVLKLMSH
jgi:6-phosphofructokinase